METKEQQAILESLERRLDEVLFTTQDKDVIEAIMSVGHLDVSVTRNGATYVVRRSMGEFCTVLRIGSNSFFEKATEFLEENKHMRIQVRSQCVLISDVVLRLKQSLIQTGRLLAEKTPE